MKPILFDKRTTNFSGFGKGFLECFSCEVTEERNGIFDLEAEAPVEGLLSGDIDLGDILGVKTYPGGNVQGFRVYKVTRELSGVVRIYANHVSYDLCYMPVPGGVSIAKSDGACLKTLSYIQANAYGNNNPYPRFHFATNVGTQASFKRTEPGTARNMLLGEEGSVLQCFGGEYEWDNWNVILHYSRGASDPVTSLRYGKNIISLEHEQDISNAATGVYAFWKGDVNGKETVVQTGPVVKDSSYLNKYGCLMFVVNDFSEQFKNAPSKEALRAAASSWVSGREAPSVSFTVDFVNLADTTEYSDLKELKTIRLCDVVEIYVEKLGVNVRAQVVKTVYDVLKERYSKIELGTPKRTLASSLGSMIPAMGRRL